MEYRDTFNIILYKSELKTLKTKAFVFVITHTQWSSSMHYIKIIIAFFKIVKFHHFRIDKGFIGVWVFCLCWISQTFPFTSLHILTFHYKQAVITNFCLIHAAISHKRFKFIYNCNQRKLHSVHFVYIYKHINNTKSSASNKCA